MTALLYGTRVLLVEDEPIIAMTAEDMLSELGCVVARTAATLSDALAAAEEGGFAVAVLDINLNGVESLPVASLLKELHIPFVFATGYGSTGRGSEDAEIPLLTKPYQLSDLEQALLKALGA